MIFFSHGHGPRRIELLRQCLYAALAVPAHMYSCMSLCLHSYAATHGQIGQVDKLTNQSCQPVLRRTILVDGAPLRAMFGLLERYSVQDATGSALRPRRSTGRGAPLTGAKRTAAQPKCPFCPLKVMPPCSHTKPWFLLFSRGEMKSREPRGEGKRETREKGNPLAPSHLRPPIVFSCFCFFMGGVDPKL